ncbi:hypothetical protein Airi01_015560 [Actinoallomurus iriomotensis]|uniref:Uncharacterized protein n=1 Tax=Actinoallomurus iriomotensis TaxID=478107 RepID=A0A9W6RCW6_9ACTN|nr:hypothetical protein Airi01_015560 [Actinoallomurus iriomotensis]
MTVRARQGRRLAVREPVHRSGQRTDDETDDQNIHERVVTKPARLVGTTRGPHVDAIIVPGDRGFRYAPVHR